MYKNVLYTIITNNFKYFSLSLKIWPLKRYQGCREKQGKKTNKTFDRFLISNNQFPVSFTAFLEKMPELRMFFTDMVLEMKVEGRV